MALPLRLSTQAADGCNERNPTRGVCRVYHEIKINGYGSFTGAYDPSDHRTSKEKAGLSRAPSRSHDDPAKDKHCVFQARDRSMIYKYRRGCPLGVNVVVGGWLVD